MNLRSRQHLLLIAMLGMLILEPASSFCETGKSGITGVVLQIGRPGPSRTNTLPQYYKGPLEVMRLFGGRLAGTTYSDEDGKFSISLPPGKYFITQSNRHLSKIHSEPITVENGKFTTVKITADNGMK